MPHHPREFYAAAAIRGRTAVRRLLLLAATACTLAPGAPARAGPLEDANKAVVLEFYDTVLNGREIDAADRLVRASYIHHNPLVPAGLAGFKQFYGNLLVSYPLLIAKIEHVVAEAQLVIVTSIVQGSNPAKGTSFSVAMADTYRLEDGMIAEHWQIAATLPPAGPPPE